VRFIVIERRVNDVLSTREAKIKAECLLASFVFLY